MRRLAFPILALLVGCPDTPVKEDTEGADTGPDYDAEADLACEDAEGATWTAAMSVGRLGFCDYHSGYDTPTFILDLYNTDELREDRMYVWISSFTGAGTYETDPAGSVAVSLSGLIEGETYQSGTTTGDGGGTCTITVGDSEILEIGSGEEALVPVTVQCDLLQESGAETVNCTLTPDTIEMRVPCGAD